jgi:ankyrin repeat protein
MNLNPPGGNLPPNQPQSQPPGQPHVATVPQAVPASSARKRSGPPLQTEQRGMAIATGDLDQRDEGGWTPLHHAIRANDVEEVRRLLRLRAHVGLVTPNGLTPLMLAIAGGQCDVIQALLETGRVECEVIDTKGYTALLHAAIKGDPHIIDLLLAAGSTADVLTPNGLNALHCAALSGHTDAVLLLMERTSGLLNTRLTDGGWGALHMASFSGHHEVVAVLVARMGVDVNQKTAANLTALHIAVINGNTQVARALLDAPDIEPDARSAQGETALHMAVSTGMEDTTVLLLGARGVDVNAVRDSGNSALHMAVDSENIALLERLLEAPRVDVNLAMPSGVSPLAMCSGFGNYPAREEAALRLLAHPDIDPNGAIFLLRSARVVGHFRRKAQAPSTLSDEDFLLQELERWSCFTPSNGNPNHFMRSATNAKLGEMLYLRQSSQPLSLVARRDQHSKDATFRLTLALEQSLQFYGGYNEGARVCAQRLLSMAPRATVGASGELLPDDHYHNQFVLGGIAHSRSDIEDMAQGRGSYALEFEIGNIAREQWGANVHQEGFLLRGRDILERLAQRGGGTAMTIEQAIASVERALTALATDAAAHAQIDSILLLVAPSRTQPMSQDIKQQMADWIATQPERAALQDAWRVHLIRLGLAQVQSQTGEVNEGGLITTAPGTLCLMQSYILQQSTLPEREIVARQLQEAVLERLLDIGREPQVCNTGCVQRLLDAAAGVDANLMAREPHDRAIFDEILRIGSVVNQAFDVHCNESEQGIVTERDQRNFDALSGTVRKDILRATTLDDLIRRRGWSRPAVEAQLNAVLDGL